MDETNYSAFTSKWDKELKDVSFILKFLNTYPIILNKLEIGAVIPIEKFQQSQKDWFNTVAKYDGLEKDFFHNYWVPIQNESLDYFIDMSEASYPIFKILCGMNEPFAYKKLLLFDSINELMMLNDSEQNVDEISSRINDKWNVFF